MGPKREIPPFSHDLKKNNFVGKGLHFLFLFLPFLVWLLPSKEDLDYFLRFINSI